MPVTAYRCKQTTQSTGSGTIQLDPGSALYRTFQQAYGASPRCVRFGIGATSAFEIVLGIYDGGSPGTLTRDLVLASSSGSRLTLPPGTKDVFAVPDLDREVIAAAASVSLGAADLGCAVVFTGASAATASLPPLASCPPGSGFLFANAGTATLTLDPSGAETVGTAPSYALPAGESCELLRVGSTWIRFNRGASPAPGGGGGSTNAAVTKRAVSAASTVDFALPSGVSALRFVGASLAASGGSSIGLQVSRNGGVSYENSSGAYKQSSASLVSGPVSASGFTNLDRIGITDILQTGSANGNFDVTVGSGSAATPFSVGGTSWCVNPSGAQVFALVGGTATSLGQVTHVRFYATASSVTGTFLMEALA